MIKVTHTPTESFENSWMISGDNIDELVSECIKKIRPRSQEYYKQELRNNLQNDGHSLIDRHAGMGYFYFVKLQNVQHPLENNIISNNP